MPQFRPYDALGLAALLFLALLGRSLVMVASVLGMALAWWATDARELSERLAAVALAAVAVALAAEAVHTGYHRVVPAETGDDTGGFWMGATLVGLIDAVAFVGWVLAGEGVRRWRQARASRSSAS